jgi:hypothetical protein
VSDASPASPEVHSPAPPAPAAPPAPSRLTHAALAIVLCAAALLRFTGLDHGIRRGEPLPDEFENFISPVIGMWDRGTPDPDHRTGYPGFFNWLVFLPMGAGRRWDGVPGAALAGRALVAAFGTLNVFLMYRLLRPPWGAGAALLGAALLATSRADVSEAHAISPDVLIVTAFLAMGLALRARTPTSAWAGVWAGLGIAVKHTGVILFPALLAELLVRRELKKRLLPVLAAAGVAFVLAAPYALVPRSTPHGDAAHLARYYYDGFQGGSVISGVMTRVETVLGWIWWNLGVLGSLLAVAGLALARPRRALVVPLTVILAALAVLSMPRALGLGGQVYPRHVLLASAAATVIAAAGYAAVARSRGVALVLAAGALIQPAWRSAGVAAAYARPGELDRAASWLETQGRPVRVATSLGWFRVNPPVELRTELTLAELTPETLAHYDLVVAPRRAAAALHGLALAEVFESPGHPDGALAVLRPAAPLADVAWPAPAATSATAPGADRAWDGDAGTAWTAPPGPGWVEARWDRPHALHAVEVVSAPGHGFWPQRLGLLGRTGPDQWEPIEALPLRPTRTRGQQPPHGQVFVLPGERRFDGLRIERRKGEDWGLAEVRAFALGR